MVDIGLKASFGCPDTDEDRVPNYRDACPEEPGNVGLDPQRSDGCPSRVFVAGKKVVITEKVQFASGRATIKKESFGLLDDVAAILKKFPGIKELQIEGHTDSQGNDDGNLKLSEQRAEAVRTYLIEHEIDEARLVSKGFGETKPLKDNDTAEGREANRRVEFNILKQDVPKVLKRQMKEDRKEAKEAVEEAKEEKKAEDEKKMEDEAKTEDKKEEGGE